MRSTLRACRLLVMLIAFVRVPVHSQSQPLVSANTSIDGEMELLKKGSMCERMSAIIALHRTGKQVIPALISHISDSDLAPDSAGLLANPVISYRPPESQNNYFAGVLYAYVVELILGRTALITNPAQCEFPMGSDDFAYSLGIIRKSGNHPISAHDLPRIKQIYSKWWGTNGKKSLVQLQKNWKRSSRPLRGSEFSWH
jgi:hypothetical protein